MEQHALRVPIGVICESAIRITPGQIYGQIYGHPLSDSPHVTGQHAGGRGSMESSQLRRSLVPALTADLADL